MKVLIDTNVLVDLALAREPWDIDARDLTAAVVRGDVAAVVSSHAISTFHYVVRRRRREVVDEAVGAVVTIYPLVPLTNRDFADALALGFGDYEDAVHAIAAAKSGADFIATRNGRDFVRSPVPTRTPGELLAMLPPPDARTAG